MPVASTQPHWEAGAQDGIRAGISWFALRSTIYFGVLSCTTRTSLNRFSPDRCSPLRFPQSSNGRWPASASCTCNQLS